MRLLQKRSDELMFISARFVPERENSLSLLFFRQFLQMVNMVMNRMVALLAHFIDMQFRLLCRRTGWLLGERPETPALAFGEFTRVEVPQFLHPTLDR